jgi:PKD repeat protein
LELRANGELNTNHLKMVRKDLIATSQLILRHLAWLLLMALCACRLHAADHILAIDVSGSMLWDKDGNRIPQGSGATSRIDIVRPALRNYVASLPADSRLFLISFNSGIVSEREFLFSRAGDREKAEAWVKALAPPRDSQTHLYATIRRVLLKAREYAASSEDQWVNVRVITDGENDHPGSSLTLQQVLDGFPEIPKGLMLPDLILLGSLKAEFMGPVNAEAKKGRINPVLDPNFAEDPFPPVIEWAPSPAVTGQEVTFFDASKSAFQAHRWLVNDQPAGEGKSVKHTFTQPGRYVVRLEVQRKSGSRDKAQAIVNVGTSPVQADFHVPGEVIAARPAEFVDRSIGEITQRKWTVEGKPSGNERVLAFTFETEGSYEVTLEVAGDNGQKGTATRKVTVLPKPPPAPMPTAGIRMVGEKFKVGESVQFMDQSEGLVESYVWDFAGEKTSSEKNPLHSFKTPGQRIVRLVVKGPGGQAETSTTIEVLPPGPTISVTADPSKGTVPFEVSFTAKIDGAYESIQWNFGDGETTSEVNPSHTYKKPGDYQVSVSVSFVGADGKASITASPLGIKAKAPLPAWAKYLIGAAVLFFIWIFGVVPFFLKPCLSLAQKRRGLEFSLKPDPGSSTTMGQVFRAHGATNWLWPRRLATVGGSSSDDIQLRQAGSSTLAVIRRVPFQQSFVLIPKTEKSVKKRSETIRLGQKAVTESEVAGPTPLTHGDQFVFGGVTVEWREKA